MTGPGGTAQPAAVERHTIDLVPDSERHGRPRDLFTMWFGTNIAPLPLVTGAMGVQVFHQSLWSGVLAVLVGQLLGGVFMALHSAQGPHLGVPQMIQSRAQFGTLGALLIVVVAAAMYVGFFASNIVLAGKSLHGLAPAVPVGAGILLGAAGSAVICLIGYRLIHTLNKIATVVLGLGIVTGIAVVVARGLPHDFFTRGEFTFAGWLATVSLSALWQLAFAPYVSDYSRYLPRTVRTASTFWATYWGSALGSMLPFLAGTVVALVSPNPDTVGGFHDAAGAFGPVLLILFLFSVINHNALNLYGAVLSMITIGQTFRSRWQPRLMARGAVSALVLACALAFALGLSSDFVARFVNLVLVLLVVLVPWTAINLIDFYLLHHGRYDFDALFAPDGGRYGRFNTIALGSYAIGIAVQIPFLATDLYTGPLAAHLGGADLSWLVGLIVTAPLYYLWSRARRTGDDTGHPVPAAATARDLPATPPAATDPLRPLSTEDVPG
ncbi:purine-cytosine permease family protein [Streptomyces pinistramenti]|uniref:purine-cytosine permease family protein n=1 Tax=Streptomyces pinistramenti TaxID=2884812 RepID=UPI001D076768|nr:cytosine permease [Streptomyces pinistramenti]MCB5909187.1 cytosine permease [Streptomyces pinistramenti]